MGMGLSLIGMRSSFMGIRLSLIRMGSSFMGMVLNLIDWEIALLYWDGA